ncbi:MAG: hypothetical protein HC824_14135 [Synechococcales cyanobacterium RM1_1_8]|nr:hypothetical protein [Synechococcales cyanobacterium RM1_1_8]
MIKTDTLNTPNLKAEVTRLNGELQVRDQLVQQLSQELFRLVKGNVGFAPSPEMSDQHKAEVQKLRDQLKSLEKQVATYQTEISERESEIFENRQTVQELTDRSRMLEQVVQELPGIYRQKFSERLNVVRDRVAELQKENRRLHGELQSVSYRLAVRSRSSRNRTGLDLPSFPGFGLPLSASA